jgi:fermentation-respiration switch protein FrsA (DUF1100 family)
MKKGLKVTLIILIIIVAVLFIAIAFYTRSLAVDMINHNMKERIDEGEWPPEKTPEEYDLEYEVVSTLAEDGLKLGGWFFPGNNSASVMIQHGTPGGRQDGLYEASILNKAGFTVLLGSFRAHDESEGDKISFGYHELKDIKAWHEFLLQQEGVDPTRVGLFGESMGGGTSILYAAGDPGVAAVATGSAFGLTHEVITLFIHYETGLPIPVSSFLASFIKFWAQREGDFVAKELDTIAVIDQISPVSVLIIHGGSDDKIGPSIGKQLFEAASDPKELLWIEEAKHVDFEDHQPELYRETLIDFFSKHLLEY